MKNSLTRPLFAAILTCSFHAVAADKKAADKSAPASETKPATPEAVDLSKFKTADELWDYISKIEQEKPPSAKTREEFVQILQSWLTRKLDATTEFLKKYPGDAHHWDVKVVQLLAANQLQRFGGARVDADLGLNDADAILAAADAPVGAKSEASYLKVQFLAQKADASKPDTLAPLQKAVDEFLGTYADSKRAPEIAGIELQLIQDGAAGDATAALTKLAESKNAQVAEMAKRTLDQKQKMAELKTKPLDLKFKATDGSDFDIAKLRGKVVLVDFWASWCGPCMGEAPNVVATYKKLHDKGFEIVGISLDQDKDAMEAALKKQGMTWTQYFDGEGWKNKISSSFGIDSIPAAWLLDKKGILRETDLRGEALGAGIEKLLAE